jgi:hypothetical protein
VSGTRHQKLKTIEQTSPKTIKKLKTSPKTIKKLKTSPKTPQWRTKKSSLPSNLSFAAAHCPRAISTVSQRSATSKKVIQSAR